MADAGGIEDKKKAHRSRNSGRKATKKKAKKDAQKPTQEVSDKQRNPKAFAFNSAVRAERKFRRKEDIDTKKQHIPLVDRQVLEPPPILIAVVGPPKVGKTTVITNLIRLFTKSPLTDIKGPVTIVTGKKRRITLIECNNDINCMIDLAKVADLVLLLIDASFGFEMEIFEFLNICQVHGMPRIMGILTHLDMIKSHTALKTKKKLLKHRFWTEVYQGAKLFYLSGILHGEYLRNEIKNLGRFISVMKFRPLTWRTTHSYLLGDRYEDLTSQELIRQNPKCDRSVSIYGYMRGVPLNKNTMIHIAGFGDCNIQDISFLPDPCPLPEQLKKRALIEKEKLIYAPFSGVGGIVYDKDAVYVELGGSHSHTKRADEAHEGTNLMTNLVDAKQTLDVKMAHSKLKIFTEGEEITAEDVQAEASSDAEDMPMPSASQADVKRKEKQVDELDRELEELRKQHREELHTDTAGRMRRKVVFDVSDDELMVGESNEEFSDEDDTFEVAIRKKKQQETGKAFIGLKENKDEAIYNKVNKVLKELDEKKIESDSSDDSSCEMDSEKTDSEVELENPDLKWKENLAKKAEEAFLERQKSSKNLMRLVYGVFDAKHLTKLREGASSEEDDDEEENASELGGLFKVASKAQARRKLERNQQDAEETTLSAPWNANVRRWVADENAALIRNCFVTGTWKQSEDAAELLRLNAAADDDEECFGDFEDLETGEKFDGDAAERAALAERKRKLKAQFDAEYDGGGGDASAPTFYDELKSAAERQAQLNRSVFEALPDALRVAVEGYRAGMYVRIELASVPAEFVMHFDATYPLVVGALNVGEENVGFVGARARPHRWYTRTLKAGDAFVVSLGWRRFQTVPLFAKLEDDLRCRYLKYAPKHLACTTLFWGPATPAGTGFLALQRYADALGFRIAATGVVQEVDKSTRVLKKLKLIGYPMKIYKKTAFIKGMFGSALEVAKFEGARIKTVSGIRGQIKKAASKPEGVFRATFEDKIQLSDIVFCRTWYKVDVPKFYTPVTTLLLPVDEKNAWRGLRTTGEIKRERGIRNAANVDSLYTEIKRDAKVFKPLVVPSRLQQALPYRDKPKHAVHKSQAASASAVPRVAVVREPKEQQVASMMKKMRAMYERRQEMLEVQTRERLAKHRAAVEEVEARKGRHLRDIKKRVFRQRSKKQLARERKGAKPARSDVD